MLLKGKYLLFITDNSAMPLDSTWCVQMGSPSAVSSAT